MGFGNFAKMAQQMQADMARVEAELLELRIEGTCRWRRRQGGRDRQAGPRLGDHRPGCRRSR